MISKPSYKPFSKKEVSGMAIRPMPEPMSNTDESGLISFLEIKSWRNYFPILMKWPAPVKIRRRGGAIGCLPEKSEVIKSCGMYTIHRANNLHPGGSE